MNRTLTVAAVAAVSLMLCVSVAVAQAKTFTATVTFQKGVNPARGICDLWVVDLLMNSHSVFFFSEWMTTGHLLWLWRHPPRSAPYRRPLVAA